MPREIAKAMLEHMTTEDIADTIENGAEQWAPAVMAVTGQDAGFAAAVVREIHQIVHSAL